MERSETGPALGIRRATFLAFYRPPVGAFTAPLCGCWDDHAKYLRGIEIQVALGVPLDDNLI